MLIFFAVFLVALDQLSKELAVNLLELHQPVPVITNFFNFTLVHNKGAAFGLFSGIDNDQLRLSLLWLTSGVAIGVVIYLYRVEAKGKLLLEFALACILAGAAGNIIDRIRLGYVIDFLDFYVGSYHWPAFNVADSAICVGVALLLIFSEKKKAP